MPPTTQRQSPRGEPKPTNGGVLGRIGPVAPVSVNRQKWAIYGQPKTGKTRFVCTFKKPMLLIGAEDGTASVAGIKGLDFIKLERVEELGELIAGPIAAGRYASVAVDTVSKLRDMRIAEILGLSSAPTQKSFGFAARDQWMQCAQNLKDILRPLLDLPRIMDLNVCMISQEANLVFSEDGGSSDLLKPSVGSALGKSLCDWLHAEVNYIGQTLIRERVENRTESIAGGASITIAERTGKKEYCLRVAPDGIYQAGFRLPEGRVLDTEFIVDPTYEKVCQLIKGGK